MKYYIVTGTLEGRPCYSIGLKNRPGFVTLFKSQAHRYDSREAAEQEAAELNDGAVIEVGEDDPQVEQPRLL